MVKTVDVGRDVAEMLAAQVQAAQQAKAVSDKAERKVALLVGAFLPGELGHINEINERTGTVTLEVDG